MVIQSVYGSTQTVAEADIVIAISKDFKMHFVKNRYFKELPIDMQFDAVIHKTAKNSLGVICFLVLREKKAKHD